MARIIILAASVAILMATAALGQTTEAAKPLIYTKYAFFELLELFTPALLRE